MKRYHNIRIISALRDRLLAFWRRKEFEVFTGEKSDNLQIIGKIYLRNPNVHLGKNITLYPGVMLQGQGDIYIGDNTYIGNNTIIYAEKGYKVSIGKDCMIAGQCYIINTDHEMKLDQAMTKQGTISADIIIENNVWIAGHVSILKGSVIREGGVIAAKALVNKETVRNGIYVGIPARLLKIRD